MKEAGLMLGLKEPGRDENVGHMSTYMTDCKMTVSKVVCHLMEWKVCVAVFLHFHFFLECSGKAWTQT